MAAYFRENIKKYMSNLIYFKIIKEDKINAIIKIWLIREDREKNYLS